MYETEVEIEAVDYQEYVCGEAKISGIRDKMDYVVVCLNFDSLFPTVTNDILSGRQCRRACLDRSLEVCRELYAALKEEFCAPVLWFGFEDYYCRFPRIKGIGSVNSMLVDQINLFLYEMLTDGDVYMDLKRLIAEEGIDHGYDDRGKYYWNVPYSVSLAKRMCGEIMRQHKSRQGEGRMKKCIVLDCDNVLWGGILAEDGIEGLELGMTGKGRKYWEFQQLLLYLYYHGILLAVCSKNDSEEVLQVFREHSGMALEEKNIVCFETGWESKAVSVRRIAQKLNMDLDSVIFIDDSLHEIREIEAELPAVWAIWYDHDDLYERLSCIYPGEADIETVERRTETYQKEQFRERIGREAGFGAAYAEKLEMRTEIHEALPAELRRIAELSQRTNRCTNGKRYTMTELKKQTEESDYRLYSVSVTDKFSNLGLVGVMGIEADVLDLFALSCRAFGRGLEEKMLECIKELGIKEFLFSETGKNRGLFQWLQECGELQYKGDC